MVWSLIKPRVTFAKLKIFCQNCVRGNCVLLCVLDIVLKDAHTGYAYGIWKNSMPHQIIFP
jgi:hypothetical protein